MASIGAIIDMVLTPSGLFRSGADRARGIKIGYNNSILKRQR